MTKINLNVIRAFISSLTVGASMVGTAAFADPTSKPLEKHERANVLVVQPSDAVTDALWFETMDQHIKFSARDLNMDVEHFFAGDDRTKVSSNVIAKIEDGAKPDYLVFSNQNEMGVGLLKICEKLDIKCFIYGAPLTERDVKEYGGPRQNLQNWIGQIIPDDEQAGFDLANTLIAQAREIKKENNDNTPIRIIGIAGTASNPASVNRTNGLRRAAASYQDVELLQIVSARWVREVAANKFEMLTTRYGGSDVVWCANNDMALGVLERARALDNPPKIGGFDWVPPAIDALKQDGLSAVIGGHEIDIAYALNLLRSYHNGEDFMEQTGTTSLHSRLIPLTPESVNEYSIFLDKLAKGKVDYQKGLNSLGEGKEGFSDISIEDFKMRISAKETLR